jgi:hypothetical protein
MLQLNIQKALRWHSDLGETTYKKLTVPILDDFQMPLREFHIFAIFSTVWDSTTKKLLLLVGHIA